MRATMRSPPVPLGRSGGSCRGRSVPSKSTRTDFRKRRFFWVRALRWYRKRVSAAGLLLLTWIFTPPSATTNRLQTAVDERMSHRQGAVVVLDVHDGQVLASYHMDVAARRLVVPGSTIKPFTLMALFDSGL